MKIEISIFGILLIIAGIFLVNNLSGVLSSCQSGQGKIVGIFNVEYNQDCNSIQTHLYLSYGILTLGGILLILGLVIPSGRKKENNI